MGSVTTPHIGCYSAPWLCTHSHHTVERQKRVDKRHSRKSRGSSEAQTYFGADIVGRAMSRAKEWMGVEGRRPSHGPI